MHDHIEKFISILEPAGLINMRLNYIGPNSLLSPHEEHNVHSHGSEAIIRTRFHLPITTNDKCESILDGEIFQMQTAKIYFFNNGCVHASRNNGDEVRLHLVWDMMLTRKCYEMMFTAGLGSFKCALPTSDLVKKIRDEEIKEYEKYPPEIDFSTAFNNVRFA